MSSSDVSEASDMSEWASENDALALVRPTFKSKEEGKLWTMLHPPCKFGTDSQLEAEWERKQRNREYRVAARREKRNRKADEKKQRKLNATILRRMVSSMDKQRLPLTRLTAISYSRQRTPTNTIRILVEIGGGKLN
jgi:hypothetical protein